MPLRNLGSNTTTLDTTYARKTAANTFTGRNQQYIQGDQSQHLDNLFEVGDGLPMGPPSPPTVGTGGAGSLTGVYQYKVAETDQYGVTTASTAVSYTASGEKIRVTIPYRRPGSTSMWVYRTSAGGSDFKRVFAFGGGYDYHQRIFNDNLADVDRSSVSPNGSDTTRGFAFRVQPNGMMHASHSIDADPAANFTFLNVDSSNGGSWCIDSYGPIVARTALGVNFYAIHAGTTGYPYRADYMTAVSTATVPAGGVPVVQTAETTFVVFPEGGIKTTIAAAVPDVANGIGARTALTLEHIDSTAQAIKVLKATGDANPTFQVDGDGTMTWGPGGGSVPDVGIGRKAAAVIGTDYTFKAGAATALSAGIHDFSPPGSTTDAAVGIRTATGTNLRLTASNTTATGATIQTQNNTPVSIGSNGVIGVKLSNGTLGFYGATPVAKAASPGTAAGTDAAVINAIITALRNLGLVT